jgi:sphingomyelin phosphodiesterase 2
MRGAAERGHLVLGLGDFNMVPLSLAHRLISTHAPVQDVWRVKHPDSSLGAAVDDVEKARGREVPTADFNMTENGATCDSVLNTWRWNKAEQKLLGPGRPTIEVPGDRLDPKAKRLDYIFASAGKRPNTEGSWVVSSAKVGMMDRHPTLQCSLSDHFSVEATLRWSTEGEVQKEEDAAIVDGESPTASQTQIDQYREQLHQKPGQFLPIETYDEILAMINKYTLRERKQRRLRLSHFGVSLIVSIGCLIAVWWSPRNFVSFLLMLLSTLGLGAGIIDGLIGGLFVGSEIRALKEFEWEIRNVRRAAGGDFLEDANAESVKDW